MFYDFITSPLLDTLCKGALIFIVLFILASIIAWISTEGK